MRYSNHCELVDWDGTQGGAIMERKRSVAISLKIAALAAVALMIPAVVPPFALAQQPKDSSSCNSLLEGPAKKANSML